MHPNKYDQKKYCLDRFIDALVEAGVAERPAPKKVRSSPLDRLRLEYVAYLRDQRWLTEATIYHCVCFPNRFMAFRFGDTLGNLNDITLMTSSTSCASSVAMATYHRNTRNEPIRYRITIMPGMKPNSWYFHLVAEAFKTCINEECWQSGIRGGGTRTQEMWQQLSISTWFLLRHFVGDRVQGSKSAADLGLLFLRQRPLVDNCSGLRKRDGEDYETAFVDEGRRPHSEDACA
jgi:hypothetical protein